jgi:HEAT repeat protein
VDIRTQDFDKELWHYLRGEYVTQFLRELKTALAARGKKLGVRLNHEEPNFTDRWYVSTYVLTPGRIYIDWERWVREGIVDEIAISGRSLSGEMQVRTIENVMQATKGTSVSVSTFTSDPFGDRLKPYTSKGMRLMLFATDDASYVKLAYPEQTTNALSGSDEYALLRLLAQAGDGHTTLTVEELIPLATHERVLVRRAALQALGRLKDPKAVPTLEAALNDPERSVRAAAVFALRDVSGPDSVAKMIEAVRKIREFQIFEAVSSTLSTINAQYLDEILRLADDPDVLMRRMGIYVLGRRGDARAVPSLVKALKDDDLYVRFRAAHALQAFGKDPKAVAAMLGALNDPSVVVQDRAATSLAIALVEGSTIKPRYGLESAVHILKTPTGPLENFSLTATQKSALAALVRKFKEFGDGSKRSDLEWGFRPVGNAMLAFGAEGGRQLQAMIDQKKDKQLAELAWQVLYIRQGMENFCLLPGADEANEKIYRTYPTRKVVLDGSPAPNTYDPTKN